MGPEQIEGTGIKGFRVVPVRMRVSEDTLAEQVQALSTLVRRLDSEVTSLKLQLALAQERLSALEGRTPEETAPLSVVAETPLSASSSTTAGYRVGAEREAAARSIGKWIRRCLEGQLRGLSGREKVNLQSRIYLVVRDFESRIHNPPLVFNNWRDCSARVTRDRVSGDSIYIGLPTKEEARIAIFEAGLALPPALTDRHA